MVCLGNICRSPLAEGIMKEKLQSRGWSFQIDSAGTGAWHEGEPPDKRSIEVAARNGIDISGQRARPVIVDDFDHFDYIFAMDRSVHSTLLERAASEHHHKIHLMLEFAGLGQADVPDPWYGNREDFEQVYSLLDEACTKSAALLMGQQP